MTSSRFSNRQHFPGDHENDLTVDSWHSIGYQLRPLSTWSRRHLFKLMRNGIYSLYSQQEKKPLEFRFNFKNRYFDNALSISNPDFENDMGQMYPIEPEIKDIAKSNTSASYLNLLLHSKYVFAPADKAANNVIIIWKRYYVEVLKEELDSTSTYVPAQLTNFFCVISILSLNLISKLTNLTCLHFIGCQSYTKILINHASYQILVTALLPSYLSI